MPSDSKIMCHIVIHGCYFGRNGKPLLGNHMRVDLAISTSDHKYDRKSSVFIGNVPFGKFIV